MMTMRLTLKTGTMTSTVGCRMMTVRSKMEMGMATKVEMIMLIPMMAW